MCKYDIIQLWEYANMEIRQDKSNLFKIIQNLFKIIHKSRSWNKLQITQKSQYNTLLLRHTHTFKLVCCTVLQCVAVCCSVLQCVAVCCTVLQCVAVCCTVLQCVTVCCSVLQCVAVCCSVLQGVAVCCSVLQCNAVCMIWNLSVISVLFWTAYAATAVCCSAL